MKNLRFRVIALVLALALLVSGCAWTNDYLRLLNTYITGNIPLVKFEDMDYTRPDITALLEHQENCLALAQAGTNFKKLEEEIWLLYTEYYHFSTQYALADIHYSGDLTDLYWQEEYNWCLETATEVDAAMDILFFALADSVFREKLEREDLFGAGFFDNYDGESIWDDTFTALMEQEATMIGRYYELSQTLSEQEPGPMEYQAVVREIADLYASLVMLRQEQATHSGYANFASFAYEFYYDRDYTPALEALYLTQIQANLVPLYRRIFSGDIKVLYSDSSEAETFDYVKTAAQNMGGAVADAFKRLEKGGLYDIQHGENKFQSSFEIFLLDYYEPFVFMNPVMTDYDKLTFAHEFGHFCADYTAYGSVVGVDGSEVMSQGMEYLSLIYGEDTQDLTRLKMLDSLCIYVEQAAYAAFEEAVYQLHPADLTGERIMALFEEITHQYGFDIWGTTGSDMVTIPHFFTEPLYVFSYVVSNDAAMQLYQKELEKPGSGLALYEASLTSTETDFLAFLASAGLHSPFTVGRLGEVKATFTAILE